MKEVVRTAFEGIAILLFGIAVCSIVSMCRHDNEPEAFRGSFDEIEEVTLDETELLLLKWEVERELEKLQIEGE